MAAERDVASAIDALLQEAYPPDQPGAAVIALKQGRPLFRKGYGMANIELGVPIEPDMVFRLGSITKQFTAVAILMLAEQGQLALEDPITRFLPEYPTHAHTITVEHLLTHTSGICSYTNMPEWRAVWRKDFAVHELIDFFKGQPMRFAPGTRWDYNNSGYHLLGAIIEQVSGQSYADFLQQRIFGPLGMRQSLYDTPARIIPRRVAGYDRGPDGYTNAEYLSMTQPYAAGALASTIDDLALWDAALSSGSLVRPDLLQRAWTPYRLADGTPTGYGYGWALSACQGHPAIEHGGGIHGFVTYAIRLPEQQVFVALLSNNPGGPPPELTAVKIAAHVIGEPYTAPEPVAVEPGLLAAYRGAYQVDAEATWEVTGDGERLHAQRTGGPVEVLVPASATEFHIEAMPLYRVVFIRSAGGDVSGLEVHGRSGVLERASRRE